MLFEKIRSISEIEISNDIKGNVLYETSGEGLVSRLSQLLFKKPQTIYDYFKNKIKVSGKLWWHHALVIASDGHPDAKKYLEPEGYRLISTEKIVPDKLTLDEEIIDNIPFIADYVKVLRDPSSRQIDVDNALADVIREFKEDYVFKCNEKGWEPRGI